MNSCFPSHLLKWVWERTKENAKCPCFFWNYALYRYIFLAFKYIMRVYVSGKKLWSMDSSLFYKVWFLSLQHRVRECQDKLLEIDIPGKQKNHLIQCFAGFSTEAVTHNTCHGCHSKCYDCQGAQMQTTDQLFWYTPISIKVASEKNDACCMIHVSSPAVHYCSKSSKLCACKEPRNLESKCCWRFYPTSAEH